MENTSLIGAVERVFDPFISDWAGPLFSIGTATASGTFTFNGNGYTLDGQGASYWDGEGTNGGATKPVGFYKIGNTSYADIDVSLIAPYGQSYIRRRYIQRCGMWFL